MSSDSDFAGRVAIVTGGGTGIGAATARLLASRGAEVVIASRTVEELQRKASEIEEATGRRCLAVPTDVKQEEQVVRMVQRTVDELGRVDVLVNNAGGTRMGPLNGLPTRGWDAAFDLNVRSAYLCTREAGRHLVAQGAGAIVNIGSGAGSNGVKGGAHYASAKAALQMLTRVTAAEWGRHGVRRELRGRRAGGVRAGRRSLAGGQPGRVGDGGRHSIGTARDPR